MRSPVKPMLIAVCLLATIGWLYSSLRKTNEIDKMLSSKSHSKSVPIFLLGGQEQEKQICLELINNSFYTLKVMILMFADHSYIGAGDVLSSAIAQDVTIPIEKNNQHLNNSFKACFKKDEYYHNNETWVNLDILGPSHDGVAFSVKRKLDEVACICPPNTAQIIKDDAKRTFIEIQCNRNQYNRTFFTSKELNENRAAKMICGT